MPTKKQLEAADEALKRIDWAKYEAMSDEEIRAHWAWDPDMVWPTEEELKEFVLVEGDAALALPGDALANPKRAAT